MKVGYRVCATLALVAIGAGGLYWQNGGRPAVAERPVAMVSASLPNIGFAKEIAESITKIELTQPEPDDEERGLYHTITLEKQGPRWEVTSPFKTRASASKVADLLENLRDLKVTGAVEPAAASYDLYGLTDIRALHVVAWAGQDEVSNLYFGRTDPRGRPLRVAGADGVFFVANSGLGGYSGFLYTRGLRGWRETAIVQFLPEDAVAVEVTKNGRFRFSKNGGTWSGSLARRDRYGKLGEAEREWAKFDPNRVEDLLRVYRSLSADDFGDEWQRAASGVDNAEQTGGVVRIRLKGDIVERTIRVGKISTNSGPWAIKNSRWAVEDGGDGTLYALAPWTADWATADASRFENAR